MKALLEVKRLISSFTPDSAKSQSDKFSKITNWIRLKNKQPHSTGFCLIESKVRKLCITQGFTLGVKGLNKQHHSKVLLNSFPMNAHTVGFCLIDSKVIKTLYHPRFHSGSQRVNKQHHSKVLLNSFPMNGHTLGFCLIESKVIKTLYHPRSHSRTNQLSCRVSHTPDSAKSKIDQISKTTNWVKLKKQTASQ